ncbi:MAG TPA: TonB-dependent hemoglobin/transferrin/lactoferrin family receptor, partial [Prosthecobacter sp.]|nr:TonB-dependent hemoglobin/transferrin/lactoferrin family receptor [Prosthecobacter sp.]
ATGGVLPGVVVVATRTARPGEEVAASATVLDQNASVFSLATSMRDFQRYEPGVSLDYGAGGLGAGRNTRAGTRGFNIRGLDGNRVLMQVDGIRQPDLFTFGNTYSVGRDYLDVDSLKRVEILKNAASSLYGSDALGGVVSFTTRDPSDLLDPVGKDWAVELRSRYGSADDSFAQTLATAMRSGAFESLLLYTHREGGELDNRGHIPPDPSNFEIHNWLGKTIWRPDDHHTFKLTGEYFQRTSENDLVSSRRVIGGPSTFVVRSLLLDDELTRYRLSFDHEFDTHGLDLFFDKLTWSLYYQDARTEEHIVENRDRTLPTPQDRLRIRNHLFAQNHLGGNVNLLSHFVTGAYHHTLACGLDIVSSFTRRVRDATEYNFTLGTISKVISPDSFPLKDMPDSRTMRIGAYIQDEIVWGTNDRFRLTPGLRLEYYGLTTDNDALYRRAAGGIPPQDYEQFALAPKLGFLMKVDEHVTAYAQYSMGFRNPTPEDLNGTVTNTAFFYQTIPNPDLRMETSHSFELGLRGNHERSAWNLAVFYNHYENFIETFSGVGGSGTPGDPTIFQSVNLSSAEIYGTEFKGETRLDFIGESLRNFTLFGSAAYIRGQNGENNQPLGSIDPFKLVAGLRYEFDSVQVELISTFFARQTRTPSSPGLVQFETPSALTVDLVGRWQATKNVSVTAGVYNLTNQKYWLYQDVRGITSTRADLDRFTQPGVNGRIAVTILF